LRGFGSKNTNDMKTMIYPYKISIKQDSTFDELFDYYKRPWIRSKNELDILITKTLLENKYTSEDGEECGFSLEEVINWNETSLKQFCYKCFNMHTECLEDIIRNLIIWGTSDECPECGYTMTKKDDYKICDNTNCRHAIDISYEQRLFDKYDISINFEHESFLN
jgi:hypothetical protein